MKFYNNDGSLTLYSFSCGYIETMEINNIKIQLYYDSCFHVTGYNHSKDCNKPFKLFWESFESNNLNQARKYYYKKIKEHFNLTKKQYLIEVIKRENRRE